MELTPLERRIKANALWAIRKRFKDGIPEGKARYLAFITRHWHNNAMDEIMYDRQTGEFKVSYDVYINDKYDTERRSIKFTAPMSV